MSSVPSRDGQRIGIFGGTFDPVHVGHLVAALEARQALELDRVLLVVAGDPWQKTDVRPVTPAEDRFAVVAAAVEGVDGLEASRLEIDRSGPSYTADTVRQLAAAHPGAELFLVVGDDVAAELRTWQRVEEVVGAVTLVIVQRGGVSPVPDPAGWEARRVGIPALEISSSDLRERLATGRNVHFLVPEAAIRCIRSRNLYASDR
ncbi:MAG TPA: nicotinic acid mononucleotide adenylyltransferase [Acidimicrobiaceae bacterium]|nr:nicotinic acid mononucleotide adenylyltransferase [Acidimicrobiaceae bacterium]